jgi:hypothetical protein
MAIKKDKVGTVTGASLTRGEMSIRSETYVKDLMSYF